MECPTSPPVIDLTPFRETIDTNCKVEIAERNQEAKRLRAACAKIGFFYVKSKILTEEKIVQTLESVKELFNLDEADKDHANAHKSSLFRGYQGRDSKSHSCAPNTDSKGRRTYDVKESFTIGAEGDRSPMHGKNQWPKNCPMSVVTALKEYWAICMKLTKKISRCLALSLSLDEHYFLENLSDPVAQMVCLHYPVLDSRSKSISSCGAHTDCGFLTLLIQHVGINALQVKTKDGKWIDAPHIDGFVLCNLGDMVEHWTNKYYRSTWHKVCSVNATSRYSLPFFCNLNFDCVVNPKTLKNDCKSEDVQSELGDPPNTPTTAGKYICAKLGLMHYVENRRKQ